MSTDHRVFYWYHKLAKGLMFARRLPSGTSAPWRETGPLVTLPLARVSSFRGWSENSSCPEVAPADPVPVFDRTPNSRSVQKKSPCDHFCVLARAIKTRCQPARREQASQQRKYKPNVDRREEFPARDVREAVLVPAEPRDRLDNCHRRTMPGSRFKDPRRKYRRGRNLICVIPLFSCSWLHSVRGRLSIAHEQHSLVRVAPAEAFIQAARSVTKMCPLRLPSIDKTGPLFK